MPPEPTDTDPRPLPPREPQLEDCCGSGCVHCVFDMYQIALENYQAALLAWQARHPDADAQRSSGPDSVSPKVT